jgi:hypothetical protein
MSALPKAIAPNPHTNLLNVYVHIANKMEFQTENLPHGIVIFFVLPRVKLKHISTDFQFFRLERSRLPVCYSLVFR